MLCCDWAQCACDILSSLINIASNVPKPLRPYLELILTQMLSVCMHNSFAFSSISQIVLDSAAEYNIRTLAGELLITIAGSCHTALTLSIHRDRAGAGHGPQAAPVRRTGGPCW